MKIETILKKVIGKIKLSEKEMASMGKTTMDFVKSLEKNIEKRKIKADVFVGGSSGKGTVVKRKKQDIDIFVRFDKKYEDSEISELLGRILQNVRARKIHGSRDYFKVKFKGLGFEVVPVLKISKPEQAKNVTDLSYFHVSYVKKKIKENPRLMNNILLAKHFCYANRVYGAESYIKGFSGYALELLIVYYKGFMNFIKAIDKSKDKIILDKEKFYKNKQEIMLEINEAKLSSPIVLVDPTFKERNVLAGLSYETFEKFKVVCKEFLRKPSIKYFERQEINKKNYNIILEARTKKQEGDIAGSKLYKFFKVVEKEMEKYFLISKKDFEYDEKKKANLYFKIKPRKSRILEGPFITALENVSAFRKKHKNVFIKNNRLYAKEKINMNIRSFINKFKKENKKRMKEMGICGLKFGGD